MMINDYYRILNCDENSTDEEIEYNYNELKRKYSEERFLEGEVGNQAAKNLTELNNAYNEVKSYRAEIQFKANDGGACSEIEDLIKKGLYDDAQRKLDEFNERNAEWHYLQSVVFYKKNWKNESKKQLEIAIQMDSNNSKYKDALDKLNAQINYSNAQAGWNTSGSTNGGYNQNVGEQQPQMGGSGCADYCLNMILCNLLLNCCCNCR